MNDDDRQLRADRLKERIYVTFAALAVTVTLLAHGHVSALEAIITLSVTVLGTLFAVFTSDVVSHLVVHQRLLRRDELRHATATTFSAVGAVVLPLAFLGAAALGLWRTETALTAGAVALLVALVGIGYLAARRVPLVWWQRLLVLGAEAALGLIVIVLQLAAHG
ncbi:hypothetical protein [Microbacterium stercoris]|uniref:Uncharacterized protein n=1 Tax=Microbacterium stercoris TaxID=2820289 RepID=A0A939QGH8_9MICO|nr:hypothetical protein [Microbacterium stercoris]MBO3662343.1 hypothetical protein [Microbacterium stercoris]MBO3664335.1 hypothetical protein [Microbacterium stercoris]